MHTKLKKKHPWLDVQILKQCPLLHRAQVFDSSVLTTGRIFSYHCSYIHSRTINSSHMNVGCWRHQMCDKLFWSLESPHPFRKLTKPNTLLKDTLLFTGNSFFKAKKTPKLMYYFSFQASFSSVFSFMLECFAKS